MVQEGGMEASANCFIAAKAESQVAYSSTDFAAWTYALELASCIDEIHTIVVVLGEACANGENIWVEDDVLGIKINLVYKYVVSTLAHGNLRLLIGCLTSLVECHHNNCCSVALHNFGSPDELFLSFFQTD
jgi:hypothetical protein